MSLEKPFCRPTRAIENDIPVNYNLMATFSKQDVKDVKNRSKITYYIVFQESLIAKEGQDIVWRYKDEKCRDQDYNELLAKISVPLGLN